MLPQAYAHTGLTPEIISTSCIVSELSLTYAAVDEVQCEAKALTQPKCDRCWRRATAGRMA